MAQRGGAFGELLCRPDAVSGETPQLHFSALVGECVDRFAIVREDAFARAKIGSTRGLDAAAIAHRHNKDLAARRYRHPITVWRWRDRGHEIPWIFYPACADVFKIRLQPDTEHRGRIGGRFELINVGAALVGDALAIRGNRRATNIEFRIACVLFQVTAIAIH